jgi:hypothetical protein
MRPLSDISAPDDLAGLAWYYWLLVERVVNATAEEKQSLLSEIELWFKAARRKCPTSPGWSRTVALRHLGDVAAGAGASQSASGVAPRAP